MRESGVGFEREDALVCADVLGGFGVSSDHVREHVPDVGVGADANAGTSAAERETNDGFVWGTNPAASTNSERRRWTDRKG